METEEKISVEQCCIYYKIETSFVHQLDEYGLIQLIYAEQKVFISYDQLTDLEKYIYLYYHLDINMGGMETIKHLLNRVQSLQQEIKKLRSELDKN